MNKSEKITELNAQEKSCSLKDYTFEYDKSLPNYYETTKNINNYLSCNKDNYQFLVRLPEPPKFISKDQIEELVQKIRDKIGYKEDDFIDIADIARKLGFKVFETTFNDSQVSGMVIDNNEKPEIYINKNDSFVRKRFTVAHELAHILLNHTIDHIIDYRKYYESYNPEEYQANMFASAILMPKNQVIKFWRRLKDIDELAAALEVSKSAVAIRLVQLGLLEDE